jgi:ABC-type amino acid transport substrate-binding protein
LLDRVVDTGIEVAQLPFHLLLRQTASQVALLPALNATFKAMQQDGTMASIVSKYDSAR